jgi:hypothetical protein
MVQRTQRPHCEATAVWGMDEFLIMQAACGITKHWLDWSKIVLLNLTLHAIN